MGRQRLLTATILGVGIFCWGLLQGSTLALQKPLWTDESYSHQASVEGRTWSQIWIGNAREGNNCPLFFSAQKALCNVFGYKWGDLRHRDDQTTRLFLRILPIFCMSLGIGILVGYFTYVYSMLIGIYAFFVAITSFMVWHYWAEARPYALIFVLTVLQAITLLEAIRAKDRGTAWHTVAVTHWLLALTIFLSVIQIFSAAFVLFLSGYRRLKHIVWMAILPILVAFGYYLVGRHYQFYFTSRGQPLALLGANIYVTRLAVILCMPTMLWAWLRIKRRSVDVSYWLVWSWVLFTLTGFMLFLNVLWFKQNSQSGFAFEISNRYLMTLTPIGIIGMVFLTVESIRLLKTRWAKGLAWVVVVTISLLPRLPRIIHWMWPN